MQNMVLRKIMKKTTIMTIFSSTLFASESIRENIVDYSNRRIVDPSFVARTTTDGAYASLSEVTSNLQSKEEKINGLNLSSNYIGDPGIERLCQSLSKASLSWIDLSYNRFTSIGLIYLLELLRANENIKYIYIFGNPAASVSAKSTYDEIPLETLSRLVLVDEKRLFSSTWESLIKDNKAIYNQEALGEVRKVYQVFFNLKYGSSFNDRYLNYQSKEDPIGEVANKIGNVMEQMNRYEEAKEWYLVATEKNNSDAPYNLAHLYSNRCIPSTGGEYLIHLNQAINRGNTFAERELYAYLVELGEEAESYVLTEYYNLDPDNYNISQFTISAHEAAKFLLPLWGVQATPKKALADLINVAPETLKKLINDEKENKALKNLNANLVSKKELWKKFPPATQATMIIGELLRSKVSNITSEQELEKRQSFCGDVDQFLLFRDSSENSEPLKLLLKTYLKTEK